MIVGEIGIRFLNQRPSYKPSSNTFAHLCSAVFFRHQPCTSCRSEPSHNFHWCCTALCMHTGVYLECKLSMVRTVLMGLNIQMHCHSCVPKSMSVARWNKQKIYTFFLEPRWLFFLPTRSALLTRVNNFESASVHGDRAICSSAWVLCMKTKQAAIYQHCKASRVSLGKPDSPGLCAAAATQLVTFSAGIISDISVNSERASLLMLVDSWPNCVCIAFRVPKAWQLFSRFSSIFADYKENMPVFGFSTDYLAFQPSKTLQRCC